MRAGVSRTGPFRYETMMTENIPSEDMIRDVVHGFYAKIRSDEVLGPIFSARISDWEPHLAKMCDFWSSIMRQTGRYQGRPMAAHLRLSEIRPEHFQHWLKLFFETTNELCPPTIAAVFQARAEMIAQSFQLGMFYRPGVAPPPKRN